MQLWEVYIIRLFALQDVKDQTDFIVESRIDPTVLQTARITWIQLLPIHLIVITVAYTNIHVL